MATTGETGTFNMIFTLELKRQFIKKTSMLFLIMILLIIYFLQIGIGGYKSAVDNIMTFRTFEEMKVQEYVNYNQYGTYGFRVLFVPSALSIFFFNSSPISQLTSNVDAGERLKIYNSFKGRALFDEKSGGFKDFSGIMLLMGSLLVLYLGYESMIHKDYSLFMTGFTGHGRFFTGIVCSRIIFFSLLVLLSGGSALLMMRINGIALNSRELWYFALYIGVLELTMLFFFSLGTIAGSMKSRFAGFVMMLVSWFVFVFLAPGVVGAITAGKSDNIISNYRLELEKLKILMDFEQKALREVGVTKKENLGEVRELIEEYWTTRFTRIRSFENRLEKEMKTNIRLFETLSVFAPTTFYLSSGNEISSKGYNNFVHFFSYLLHLKERFVRFCLDKRYYSDPPPGGTAPTGIEVENFTRSGENLYYSRSRLPNHLMAGGLLTLLYIAVLLFVSYIRFKKSLKR